MKWHNFSVAYLNSWLWTPTTKQQRENAMNFENTIFNNDAINFVNEDIQAISEAPLIDFWGTEFVECAADEDALIADEFFQ